MIARDSPAGRASLVARTLPDPLLVVALASLAVGAALHVAGTDRAAHALWAIGLAVVLVPLVVTVARSLRRGDVGVDLIALVAMTGTLALGEYLAGVVVAVMFTGGSALERAANGRARRELVRLVERAPKTARVHREGAFRDVPVEDVAVGDRVLVRSGEVVPVDGVVRGGVAVVDESALTGEPLPAVRNVGEAVSSGSASAGEAFEIDVARRASESTYAAIVRLVRDAETQRAPFVRMADRFAVVMLPITLAIAGGAWLVSGDAVRAVAVLVVATPCPLILAAPVALISGVARAARVGVIVKGGGVIEQLGAARTVLFDKTGTLTHGRPAVGSVLPRDGASADDVLRAAASLEQYSVHVVAAAILREAGERGVALARPRDVAETPGSGIGGDVDGRRVLVGGAAYLREHGVALPRSDAAAATADVLVAVDGRLAGEIEIADRVRPESHDVVPRLRRAGVRHVAMVSGDRRAAAEPIGDALQLDAVYAEQSPEDKLTVVRAIRERPDLPPVVMVGDGINDAPALALADVGVAMGAAGATVAAETADAVIVVDRVDRVADAVEIGRRSMHIARQSVVAGLVASFAAMVVAAAGALPPVYGALLQEGIDVAVIVNALRALRD